MNIRNPISFLEDTFILGVELPPEHCQAQFKSLYFPRLVFNFSRPAECMRVLQAAITTFCLRLSRQKIGGRNSTKTVLRKRVRNWDPRLTGSTFEMFINKRQQLVSSSSLPGISGVGRCTMTTAPTTASRGPSLAINPIVIISSAVMIAFNLR